MHDPLLGRMLGGRYEILGKVGEGGMAVVYRGRDSLLDRIVAVKVLRNQFAADKEFLDRFRLEARAAASLSHGHVVNIYDVGEHGGNHFIVMEYIDGDNLKQRIKQQGPLTAQKTVEIAIQIAKALQSAHERGLVHRDIKPHNILITHDGHVKVTDFGIARAASASSLTQTGTVIGSVHYFSPEQAKGDHIDQGTDLYSLGVVMYEMLTGKLPFVGDNPVSVAIKHLQDQPQPIKQHRPDIPPQLEAIVMRLLAKEKHQRFAGAHELLTALQDLPLSHENDEPPWTARAPIHREKAPSHDPQLDPTLVMPKWSPVQTPSSSPNQEEEDMSDQARPRSRRRWIFVPFILLLFVGAALASMILPDIIFPAEVDVPDVVGLTSDEARALLSSVGLRLKEDGFTVPGLLDAGQILRQEPEADHRVRKGREILVTISSGPEKTVVPDLLSRTKIEAQLLITQGRLTLGDITEQFVTDALPNTVIAQDPPPGAEVLSGQPISLVVARGSQLHSSVTMPNVKGMPLQEAQQLLQSIGLAEGQLHAEPHPTADENEVIDQNPPAGEVVEMGYPYALAYAVRQASSDTEVAQTTTLPVDKHWDNRILINVPEGPAREVVVVVIDDFGPRQVFREVRQGGSRFYEVVRLRGDIARIQVFFDGVEQMNEEVRHPGAGA